MKVNNVVTYKPENNRILFWQFSLLKIVSHLTAIKFFYINDENQNVFNSKLNYKILLF